MAAFTFTEMSPAAFLERSAEVHGHRVAVVDGEVRLSYRELYERSARLTGVLSSMGVQPGDRVAALCTNSHVMLELHHAAPMRSAVLVPLNTRLAPAELEYILSHSRASVLFSTADLEGRARTAAERLGIPVIVAGPTGEYEQRVRGAEPRPVPCSDERSLLGINYTSGTTGRPKGVMTHHRGAYLQSLALAAHLGLTSESAYLWTLPMFHCNGWCLPWAVTAVGARHICLRAVDVEEIWHALRTDGVTHFSAAPTVLTMISAGQSATRGPVPAPVRVQTGGAPPSPPLLDRLERLNFDVTHLYGLTETFGPIAINEWRASWTKLDASARATLRVRQGVGNLVADRLRVVDSEGNDVRRDGSSIGEILVRGNSVMLGYYGDEAATEAAMRDGWFRTGDLAVHHPDGYVEIRDRAKDVIISGGENIASVEVERVIDSHPAVLESAVIGVPDEVWGQVPHAYVTLRFGATLEEDELKAYVRAHLAGFKVPKRVHFADLPKTSTGKIQKQLLRMTSENAARS